MPYANQAFGNQPRLGATSESFDRTLASSSFTPTTGTLYLHSHWAQYANFSKVATAVTGTPKAGGSHGGYVVCDAFGNVLATTVDQTDAATTWGTANAEAIISLAVPYQSYLAQLTQFLIGFYIVASTMPTILAAPATAANIGGVAFPPIINCTGGVGFTTPPAVGSQLVLSNSNNQAWQYTL
jgi:hypothetical protein